MVSQNELVARLKDLGIRLTPQRMAVAEVVLNSGDHPTVKDIFERVKDFSPYITLATVYSTLSVLAEYGIIRELPFQRQSRYDANLSPHVNLACTQCGTVIDANVGREEVEQLGGMLKEQAKFEVVGQRVDFYGLCAWCAAAKHRGSLN